MAGRLEQCVDFSFGRLRYQEWRSFARFQSSADHVCLRLWSCSESNPATTRWKFRAGVILVTLSRFRLVFAGIPVSRDCIVLRGQSLLLCAPWHLPRSSLEMCVSLSSPQMPALVDRHERKLADTSNTRSCWLLMREV